MLVDHSEDDGGDPLSYYLGEYLEIDDSIAEELAEELDRQEDYDRYDPCSQAFYDGTILYRRGDPRHYAQNLSGDWQRFEENLKHNRRFFDPEALVLLDRLTGGRQELLEGGLAIVTIGPWAESQPLFRGRCADSKEEAASFLKDPMRHIGPPPKEKARASRMTPHGVPVFYGALSKVTAVAELRPAVGAYVVVAEFRPTREVVLLDLVNIHRYSVGSPFADDYQFQIGRKEFLGCLHQLIVRPVVPNAEHLEYLPTQAFADYVANVLKLDGIVYGSTQVGALPKPWDDDPVDRAKCNVVILNVTRDPMPLEYVRDSARVCEIESARYEVGDMPWIGREHLKKFH
jgi:hypothetical protein